jgi:hypothetical protein
MRVVINQKKIRRNRKIAQYAFFITLGVLIIGLFITNAAPSNPVLLLAPLVVLPIAIGATMYSVRMANSWLREPRPEAVLKQALKGISSRSVLYHYALPANHVLITPQGVFVFVLRPQEGHFTISGKKWSRRGGMFKKFMTFFRQDSIGHPDTEAMREAAVLQEVLDRVLPDSGVTAEPVVVFSSPYAELEVIESTMPVVSADPKQKPSLKSLMKDAKAREGVVTLDQEQIEALEAAAGITEEAMG